MGPGQPINLEEFLRGFIKPLLKEIFTEELAGITAATQPAGEIKALELLRHREYLTSKEIEALYGLNHKTLADWRSKGRGPTYIQDGGVILYRRLDVEAWLKSARKRTIEQPGLK